MHGSEGLGFQSFRVEALGRRARTLPAVVQG